MTNKVINVDPKDIDVVIGMDKSGSMGWGADRSCKGKTRWAKGEESLTAIAQYMEAFDDDGLTVFLFNDSFSVEDGVTADRVPEIFRTHHPDRGTVLAPPLKDLIERFLPAKSSGGLFRSKKYTQKAQPVKPVCFIIFTDGCPNDQSDVAATIVDATKRTDQGNVGFLFVQVGYDDEAEKFLKWLDTNLRGADYDCVTRVRLEDIEDKTPEQLVLMAMNGTDNS